MQRSSKVCPISCHWPNRRLWIAVLPVYRLLPYYRAALLPWTCVPTSAMGGDYTTVDDLMEEMEESWGTLLPNSQKRLKRPSPQQAPHQAAHQSSAEAQHPTSKALLALVLRHESQLQALAMDDQYIIFLQSDPRGALPGLYQATTQWNHLQQKGQTSKPLRTHLFESMAQELTRVEKVMAAKPQDDLWTGILSAQLITQQGAWNYVQYCPKQKYKLQDPYWHGQDETQLRCCGSRPWNVRAPLPQRRQ